MASDNPLSDKKNTKRRFIQKGKKVLLNTLGLRRKRKYIFVQAGFYHGGEDRYSMWYFLALVMP